MEMEKKKKKMKKETSRNAQSNVIIIIPEEIVFEIMTRLPAKSLSRFRCVSKHWNSTISDRHFVELHHNRSLTRPGGTNLFITFPRMIQPRPRGIEQKYIRCIYSVVNHHHHHHQREEHEEEEEEDAVGQLCLPLYLTSYISHSLHGLICFVQETSILILNPTTCDCIVLPPTTQSDQTSPFDARSFLSNVTLFGYDPVNNQHKVLNTRFLPSPKSKTPRNQRRRMMITKHRVFVLGGASWRVIVDVPPHFPCRMDDVCFNGAIYYRAYTSTVNKFPLGGEVLVEFDVRLETFRFIQLPNDASLQPLKYYDYASGLIQIDGHLAVVDYQHLKSGNTLDIWILEDSLKPTWVHKTVVFSSPAGWTDLFDKGEWILDGTIGNYFLAGTTRTGEIIIAPHSVIQPFYLFYLDLKNHSVRRVKIGSLGTSGMTLGGGYTTITVTDHVESILSLSGH